MPDDDWLDLDAIFAEELESIRTGGVRDTTKQNSARGSEARAQRGETPEGLCKPPSNGDLWALCLSGGGIRSATFALGLLQGLARAGLLERFDYLSTVSGGGYIGSWLSSWIQRHPGGRAKVIAELAGREGEEAKEIRYLRSFTAYLTPQSGLFSADTWTIIATYLRNLLLNWLIILPALTILLLTPKVGLALIRLGDGIGWLRDHRGPMSWLALAIGILGLFIGVRYVFIALFQPVSGRSGAASTEGQRTQGQFLLRCLLPLMIAAWTLPLAWAWQPEKKGWWWPVAFAAVGAALRFAAWLASRHKAEPGHPLKAGRDRWVASCATLTGAFGGLLLWGLDAALFPGLSGHIGEGYQANHSLELISFVCFSPPIVLLVMLVTEALFIGLVSRQTDDEDREWWGRAGGWLLIAGLFWMGLRVLVLFGPLLLLWLLPHAPIIVSSLGGLSGIATAALGYWSKSSGNTDRKKPTSALGMLQGVVLTLAATVFVCALFAGLALASDWILSYASMPGAQWEIDCAPRTGPDEFRQWTSSCATPAAARAESIKLLWLLLGAVPLLAVACVAQYFVNINRFSLHALYRARLIRAYLGASNADRKPSLFTGFDPSDNVYMTHLLKPVAGNQERRPFHILNLTINLVSLRAEQLAWQERKAESMTVSPLHCGSASDVGYRRSEAYARLPVTRLPDGITLGTAMTISGAAASPNMGYHSSPIVALIMTLFNVRLGAWLGNPGRVGDKTFEWDGPRWAAQRLFCEALGLTNDHSKYVYLSDGGHFENLGLYEMVRRRCRLIVVSDAGCDPKYQFDDLGNAIRKIRIDFGVEIAMGDLEMHPRPDPDAASPAKPGRYFAVGEIRYPKLAGGEQRTGKLIYIKPGLYGGEPQDVLNYAATHPDFPHESTADQWFNESQFESYRRLGLHVAGMVFGDTPLGKDFDAEGLADALLHRASKCGTGAVPEARARLIHGPRRSTSWFAN
jgi:hypothetical protein